MTSLVTGATGFIGRFLVERLVERDGDIHVLVREASVGKIEALNERQWRGGDRIKPVVGDLGAPALGIDDAWIAAHKGQIDHFFHLAAIYDMTASDEANDRANVGGTRSAVGVANELEVGCFHQVSSVAAAGMYEGRFTEDMFDEGQPLDHPYHRTKFESEKIAREETDVPWRVYRPAIVVGHSKTGEMDKIDGPYYFFKVLAMGARLPDLMPLFGAHLGATNVVPVDFVADAIDYLAHEPGLDGRAFHLVNPEPQPTAEVLNLFAKAAGAPQLRPVLPESVVHAALAVPGVKRLLPGVGIPQEVADYAGFTATFDAEKTSAALAGSGIAVPPIESYAQVLWDYWREHLAQ